VQPMCHLIFRLNPLQFLQIALDLKENAEWRAPGAALNPFYCGDFDMGRRQKRHIFTCAEIPSVRRAAFYQYPIE
jgi:hypothetical protein